MQTGILAALGVVGLFVGWLLTVIVPSIQIFGWGILAVGMLLIALVCLFDFRRARAALASRQGKLGLSATVRISLFIGTLVFVNAIGMSHYHRFDLTGLAQFTLTSQTKGALGKLDKPVEIVSFFTPRVPITISSYTTSLLSEYRNCSTRLTVRNVDPDLHPDQARQYGVDSFGAEYGVVVFRNGGSQLQVFGPQIADGEAEHAFTSAILEVSGAKQKKVYFLTGDGESSVSSDYSDARSGLQDNLFQVEALDLKTSPEIPKEAAVVVIAGPQQPPTKNELESIRTFLKSDGRALLLLNPNSPLDWRQLAADWGVEISQGFLIDPSSHVAPDQDNLLVPKDRNSFGLEETHFPGAAAVIPKDEKPRGLSLAPLAWTSQQARLEEEGPKAGAALVSARSGRPGPFAIGAMISAVSSSPADQSASNGDQGQLPGDRRLVVIGDSDFASDRSFYDGNNGELFLSAVNWLAAGKEIISVDRKVLPARRLLLDPDEARFLDVSSIGLLPLLLFVAGGYVWWRRRRS